MSKIIIFTDGGSRGNPGPSALGVYIENEKGEILAKIGKRLGTATNNVAEYKAILEGLDWLISNKNIYQIQEAEFNMDSQLAFKQLIGLYKIKNTNLRMIHFEIKQKEAELKIPVIYKHVRREKNINADLLVNLALDNKI